MGLWNKQTINFVKYSLKVSQDYYPEILGKIIVCNVPMIFTGIYSIMKGWIDERTRRKITIVGDPTKVIE